MDTISYFLKTVKNFLNIKIKRSILGKKQTSITINKYVACPLWALQMC